MTPNVCRDCGVKLTSRNWWKSYRARSKKWCAQCARVIQRRYQMPSAHFKARYQELRAEMLLAYGGRCACCGEREPAFLTIDHINGDGKAHRANGGAWRVYTWLRRHGYPKEGFQLLCWNCNTAKYRLGLCPHGVASAERTLQQEAEAAAGPQSGVG